MKEDVIAMALELPSYRFCAFAFELEPTRMGVGTTALIHFPRVR